MPLQYCMQTQFTNQPSNAQFKSQYGINMVFHGTGGAFSNTTTLTLNVPYINSQVDFAIDNGYDGIIWDEEYSTIYNGYDKRQSDDATIDFVLNALQSLCVATKSRCIARGKPNFKVGLYGHPSFADDYDVLVNYQARPDIPARAERYATWLDAKIRCGQRYTGTPGQYTSVPFTSFCDFICPSLYMPYGRLNGTTVHIDAWGNVATLEIQAVKQIASSVYPYFTFCYSPYAQWGNQTIDGYAMTKALDVFNQYADGMIMWAWAPSIQYGNFTNRPSSYTNSTPESTVLSQWTGITNGAFVAYLGNTRFVVTGINTLGVTGATGMSSVCGAIQSRMNAAIGASATITGNTYQVPLGPVSVAWDSTFKSYYFNFMNATGSTNTSQPPNAHRANYNSSFWYPIQMDAVAGATARVNGQYTEVSTLIGQQYTNQQGKAPDGNGFQYAYSGRTAGTTSAFRSQYEWDDYAVGQPWWELLSARGLSQQARVAINAANPTSGSYVVVGGAVLNRTTYNEFLERNQ